MTALASGNGLAAPTNLVLPRSPLLGRADVLEKVQRVLLQEHVALLTLTGPGGIGKTRLALQAAANVLDHFDDGVYFVSLAPISDAALVLPAIAHALGVRETQVQTMLAPLQNHLRARQMLLVLDNFEQVLPATPAIAELLHACAQLKVLATSRSPLRLYGEHEFAVPPLALPEAGQLGSLAQGAEPSLRGYAAVDLFCRRAEAAQASFTLTPAGAIAVAKICIGLDGLPLAIELAAARIKMFGPAAMLAHLRNRLALVTGGSHDLPARQRTLRTEIAWSYDLLKPAEQMLFRRLAIFAGGFTLQAAKAVGNAHGDASGDVLDGIESLVDSSLVHPLEGAGGEHRFDMLETIRAYALEQLEANGETELLRHYHAGYFLVLAEQTEPELWETATAQQAIERLLADFDNLRAAAAWTGQPQAASAQLLERIGAHFALHPVPASTAEMGVRLAGAVAWFGLVAQRFKEVYVWLSTALLLPAGSDAARAKALWGAGTLAFFVGDYTAARSQLEASLKIYRHIGDPLGVARALRELCVAAYAQGELVTAQCYGEESVAMLRALGRNHELPIALDNLGATFAAQGKLALARQMYEEEFALSMSARRRADVAWATTGLGLVAALEDDDLTAIAHFENALVVQRELGEMWTFALTLNLLGEVVQRQGDWERAANAYRESLRCAHASGDKACIANVLHQIGALAHVRGQHQVAARLVGASARQRTANGGAIYYTLSSPSARAAAIAAVRESLGKRAFAACWEDGQTMALEQAVALAVATTEAAEPERAAEPEKSRSAAPGFAGSAADLTVREAEVLRLLVEGLSYAQIAEKLVISRRTVNSHLTVIYSKIGVNSRAQATNYVLRHKLS
jgi:predicted ATPase/DNA-binding NarL/FixJ family response regulator